MFFRGPGVFTNCGCYIFIDNTPKYIPQVQAKAHTTILATTSRINLTQTFINPSEANAIDELRYVFPLYDGVSVVAFTCTVGSRVIKGVVKERQKAQQVYDQAKAQGQVAGLLKQSLEAADTFTTTIGNVPAGEKIQVDITYLGELKHDAQVDGLRFMIPTQIVPRYGVAESLSPSNVIQKQGISFSIDAEMPDGSTITSVDSPSHPISVEIGTTSTTKSQEPSLQRASATLQQGMTHLEKDFVVQVVATKLGEPSALLETHPTIPNQRAIMTTLVPKFKLPAEKPEIVFICDRSGSMSCNIPNLRAALEIFLKSLPVGIKFNICSFGSHFNFLWDRSQTYSQETLDKAIRHVHSFKADYGGTSMYEPFEATFQKRYKDMNLEVFLLTDGEIWDQDRLFTLINKEVADGKGAARVFSLGIGSGASTSLIEGIARAGSGFAQTVGDDEKMDKKVVRMLKGALLPHITDYSLEIKYEKADASTDEDDFELVEKVVDALKIDTPETNDKTKETEASKKPIPLFDTSADIDDTGKPDVTDINSKHDHLPDVPAPRYLQTPTRIPPLFLFNRTTVYVLLSDTTPAQQPKSVVLKATSRHGPLELEIPITTIAEKASVIHCLAARKEIKELEEGRGWLIHAKDTCGKFLKERHDGHFSDLVEREAVGLGVKYQVGGKWCSFVAVEDGDEEKEVGEAYESSFEASGSVAKTAMMPMMAARSVATTGINARKSTPFGGGLFSNSGSTRGGLFGNSGSTGGGLFGNSKGLAFGSQPTSSGLFGAAPAAPAASRSTGLFGNPHGTSASTEDDLDLFGSNTAPPGSSAAPASDAVIAQYQREMAEAVSVPLDDGSDEDMGFALMDDGPPAAAYASYAPVSSSPPEISSMSPLQALITLQTFSGSWSWSADLERVLGVTAEAVSKLGLPAPVTDHAEKDDVVATACAILFFKNKLKSEEGTWEMLVEKAEGWMEDMIGEDGVKELDGILGQFFT
ncbi:hypothetical protein F66182_551 [Fusarium sp. NRRL 66182]|nr:hypothetical protein F66182_551 [Fusarium sp. NRRL 66182]